jgi:hypothetical protein
MVCMSEVASRKVRTRSRLALKNSCRASDWEPSRGRLMDLKPQWVVWGQSGQVIMSISRVWLMRADSDTQSLPHQQHVWWRNGCKMACSSWMVGISQARCAIRNEQQLLKRIFTRI